MEDGPVELARCHEHDVALFDDEGTGGCIACECDIEARPGFEIGQSLNDTEFRSRVTYSTARELVPILQDYLQERGEGPVFVTHIAWNGTLPAGYTEQERFVPFVSYEFGVMAKHISTERSAQQTIEDLREEGFSGDQ